jgi:hypothetical protein
LREAGWEASRGLDGMDKAGDFYMQGITQVSIDRWVQERVALVSGAGYLSITHIGNGNESCDYWGIYPCG